MTALDKTSDLTGTYDRRMIRIRILPPKCVFLNVYLAIRCPRTKDQDSDEDGDVNVGLVREPVAAELAGSVWPRLPGISESNQDP